MTWHKEAKIIAAIMGALLTGSFLAIGLTYSRGTGPSKAEPRKPQHTARELMKSALECSRSKGNAVVIGICPCGGKVYAVRKLHPYPGEEKWPKSIEELADELTEEVRKIADEMKEER